MWDYALDLKNFHQASHALTIGNVCLARRSPLRVRMPKIQAERWTRCSSAGDESLWDKSLECVGLAVGDRRLGAEATFVGVATQLANVTK